MAHGLSWGDLTLADLLGEGHSGSVFRGTLRRSIADFTEGTSIAVKRYRPWVLDEPGQIERIFREVETGRSVRHPHLMRVLGAVLDNERQPAMVMAYYEGPTLEVTLAESRRENRLLPVNTAFEVLGGMTGAVAALHDHGIIHRDIKPANVIMSSAGPILTDFGVVRSSELPEQTTTGAFLGTIRYAAPEYLFGEQYDNSIDTYSLGATAYELFTGLQYFGDHQHWARLVAAKARDKPLESYMLDEIASRSSINTARFLRYVIDGARAPAAVRKLSLKSLCDAIDAQLWTGPFVTNNGLIVRGTTKYPLFGNARGAAKAIKRGLSKEDIVALRDLLRDYFWLGWAPRYGIDRLLLDDLVHMKVVDSGFRARQRKQLDRATFAPAVLEAFALDLF